MTKISRMVEAQNWWIWNMFHTFSKLTKVIGLFMMNSRNLELFICNLWCLLKCASFKNINNKIIHKMKQTKCQNLEFCQNKCQNAKVNMGILYMSQIGTQTCFCVANYAQTTLILSSTCVCSECSFLELFKSLR